MEPPPPSSPRVPSRSFLGLGLGFLVAIAALLINFYNKPTIQPKLWTAEELILYNGTDESLPIFLGILGSVFDVTKGKSHYGPGGGYHHFAGRDASRAFVSGNFTGDGLTDSLHGLASTEVNSIVDWRKFYNERYMFVGKLVGRYYDDKGNPTKYLKGVEAKAKRGAQLLEKQKIEEAKIPSCNSRWSDQEGGKVWCDMGYPRLVKRPLENAISGKLSQRCACFKEEELDSPDLEDLGPGNGGLFLSRRKRKKIVFDGLVMFEEDLYRSNGLMSRAYRSRASQEDEEATEEMLMELV